MKTCSACKEIKDETDFYAKGKENRTSSMCKLCFSKYCMQRWTERKARIVEQFGDRCADCKQTYHQAVYEFHHLDSNTKEYAWAKLRLRSEETVQAELSKCVMLCANCHRMRHVSERLSS